MAWEGRARAGNRHSDKEKFCNDLMGQKRQKCQNGFLKKKNTTMISTSGEKIKAEYEGSIPFTRSKTTSMA